MKPRIEITARPNLQHAMVGESAAMKEVYRFLLRVAPTESTVLLGGESGTGKELVARAIHRNSPRSDRPFVAINCATIPEGLLESELFGYERGAFTGAATQKKGRLEMADGGVVFLDEIGELAPALQVKLLRVLQEREFERLGGSRPLPIDIRLIAATNKDLATAVKSRSFREDLYYRLNVVALVLPRLRERAEDIPMLAEYFVAKFAAKCKVRARKISPEAMVALMNHHWPGNVRELENAIERALVLGVSDTHSSGRLARVGGEEGRSARSARGQVPPGGYTIEEAPHSHCPRRSQRQLYRSGSNPGSARQLSAPAGQKPGLANVSSFFPYFQSGAGRHRRQQIVLSSMHQFPVSRRLLA